MPGVVEMINNGNFVSELLNIITKHLLFGNSVSQNGLIDNLAIVIFLDDDKCGVCIQMDQHKESFIMSEAIDLFTVAALFDIISQEYALQNTNLRDEEFTLAFTRECTTDNYGLNAQNLNLCFKEKGHKRMILALESLTSQYYKTEMDDVSRPIKANSKSKTVNYNLADLTKEDLISIFNSLSLEELQTLVSFVPVERILMLVRGVLGKSEDTPSRS